ncbi:phosphoenolpyruvate synthase [Acidaminobacter sp.]|uniref:phosphoenolpyruvate synthase n=1 Tax=Acidaminobacter sp. TaxID=1872102 RepID=UPI0025632057|nr:phosphoenolpyruvate synthase [Acidaminobacter sp.]MDK9711727.1 phosphoenolpyruvate synthase [Acidaminobacter sp.]
MPYVIELLNTDRTMISLVGGKGANLGELSKLEGIRIPNGFCITVEAFNRIMETASAIKDLMNQLSTLTLEDQDRIKELSSSLRSVIEGIPLPEAQVEEITLALNSFEPGTAFAIRSSATAEDLPTASFAGQQDTYLNVTGKDAILEHISKCWASLFTERAITYRILNSIDHHQVQMAVIVQEMISPEVSGILFTVDPVTSNRKVSSIDAGFGLGEALVSGLVNPDVYKVRSGEIIDKKINLKKLAIVPLNEGGTQHMSLPPAQQTMQALTDNQILELESIGRKIEEHFDAPQDIEWCLADGHFYVVQSRPITTLFPIPDAADQDNHVYVSVGHQQMMTDAMKPLGLSFFLMTTSAPMAQAGGRLFVDVTQMLVSPVSRPVVLDALGRSDPLIKDALLTVLDRENFIKIIPADEAPSQPDTATVKPAQEPQAPADFDPSVVSDLIHRSQASLETLKQDIQAKTGPELLDFIQADLKELKALLFDPLSMKVLMAGFDASKWINDHLELWLGEKNAADVLSQSVPNNVTSEMGMALLDVADILRPFPIVIEALHHAKEDDFFEALFGLEGGQEAMEAISAFLDRYGMRCPGEIDITRRRWAERPSAIVSVLLSHIKNFEVGESKRKFEDGLKEALNKEAEILSRLRSLPDGEDKARETQLRIRLIRDLSGYREYPKYGMISRYFIYKQALLIEAARLVGEGILQDNEDIFYLSFESLQEVVRTKQLDYEIIRKRKIEFQTYEKLKPFRVMTSEGEMIAGAYKRDSLPDNALLGLPVSSGIVEGRARVILNMEEADLEEDDILVTTFTDPSWTPLFLSIKGLVTEVGGLMTHGAVIAREYGLPAVVGVVDATRLIKDGQRIRVNGTEGVVEIL